MDSEEEKDEDAKSEPDRSDVPASIEDDEDDQISNASTESGSESVEHSTDSDDDAKVSDCEEAIENDDSDDNDEDDANNTVEDGTKPDKMRPLIHQLVQRVRRCVSYIRSIRAINDHVQSRATMSQPPILVGLVVDLEIRWNSTFMMLDRFITHRVIINEITSEPYKVPHIKLSQRGKLGSKKLQFNNSDWCLLIDLQSLLKPFLVATNTISARNYPTLATAYSSKH
jgi:hypothetical protein